MWRVTGDQQYREYGWKVFEAFERFCKVEAGYAGTGVRSPAACRITALRHVCISSTPCGPMRRFSSHHVQSDQSKVLLGGGAALCE